MFVLLGSNGQVTSRLAQLLLAGKHPVRVVGRHAGSLAPLAAQGADLAVGDLRDAAFLAHAFAGATAAYTMVPPCHGEDDMRVAQDRIGEAIAAALKAARVPRVVNLSSIGAELPAGTGPIEGLHAQEQRLHGIAGLDLLHLRPGSFMENLLAAAPVVAAAGVLPGMEAPDALVPMVATRDVAAVAARELVTPQRRGALVLHAPCHVTPRQAAAALGVAIGRPGLAYVQVSAADGRAELQANGFSASAAERLDALARWLSTSPIGSAEAAPAERQPTTIEAFAREVFAPAFARLTEAAAA